MANETLGDILNMAMTPSVQAMVNGKPISKWVEYALKGEKINAIKELRSVIRVYDIDTGAETKMLGLKAAKDIIESMFP